MNRYVRKVCKIIDDCTYRYSGAGYWSYNKVSGIAIVNKMILVRYGKNPYGVYICEQNVAGIIGGKYNVYVMNLVKCLSLSKIISIKEEEEFVKWIDKYRDILYARDLYNKMIGLANELGYTCVKK